MRYFSTNISPFGKVGDSKTIIKMLKEAGFPAYDFSMDTEEWLKPYNDFLSTDDYIEKAKDLRAYADSLGIVCNQSHAPFSTAIVGNDDYNEKMFDLICRAIEVSGILGVKVCVVHPCNDYTAEENAKLYKRFEPIARKAGVKIGVENMWNWDAGSPTATPAACSHHDDFKKHLDLLPKDVFVACVDLGHAQMAGLNTSAVQMIETLADRLEALHVHDVDGVHDNHQLPFTQATDFEAIIQALKKVNYQGDITLESNCFAERAPLEIQPAVAKYMAVVAEYFKNRLDD